MTRALSIKSEPPRDAATGLILPLRTFLGSQELAQHRAMVSIELEVLAKKFDRFGWDRDRGTMAQDRLISDWMDALQDFPLEEVKAACSAAVMADPKTMPNEGHIVMQIMKARATFIAANRPTERQDMERPRITAERAKEIMREVGFRPKSFGGQE
jgi:hypothetical protein